MIADHEFLINREKTFKNSKYIIIARLEVGDNNGRIWDGQVN
jgi:hypothetical protein